MRASVLGIALLLTGCVGYQYGDGTDRALEAQAEYCAQADPYQRAVRMVLMQRAGIPVPAGGACVDILEVLGGDVSE